jgi:hypothetical protein
MQFYYLEAAEHPLLIFIHFLLYSRVLGPYASTAVMDYLFPVHYGKLLQASD